MQYFTKSIFALTAIFALQACSESEEPQSSNPPLPSTLAGEVVELQVSFAANNAPYAIGQTADFHFGQDGSLAIDIDPNANNGMEVNIAQSKLEGSDFVWQNNSEKYVLSLTSSQEINEINVYDLNNTLLNQWNPTGASATNLQLLINLQGSYTVQNVLRGTHNRGTVIIGADGSLDFDNNVSYSPNDYALISDRIDVLNGIWVDCNPYPSSPYPRFQVYVADSDPNQLERIEFFPNYSSSSGRVEVEF